MITKQTQFAIANYKLGLNKFPESWVVVDNLLGETQHYCVKNHMSCFVDREIVLWHIIQMTVRHLFAVVNISIRPKLAFASLFCLDCFSVEKAT